MLEQEPWVSVDEVARHLGVSQDTIYRWIEVKHLPAHRVGRLWRFRLSYIDEWVQTLAADQHLRSHDQELAVVISEAGEVFPEKNLQPNDQAVYRPYQYLGAKLRSLGAVVSSIAQLAPRNGHVVDLFSGSSVVSQAFADAEYRVTAFDALSFCTEAAKATLGVERNVDDNIYVVACKLIESAKDLERQSYLFNWVEEEDALINSKDGIGLLRLSNDIPQVWRPRGASGEFSILLTEIASGKYSRFTGGVPICSTHYAGTYFGVRQAVAIDALRQVIETSSLSPWVRSAALTALVSAMSAAAFTAGKHFAQPHKICNGKDLDFHQRRALFDRAVDIHSTFLKAVKKIAERPWVGTCKHAAYNENMESLRSDSLEAVDVVYADPPYTAQQYSRFYHVPEIIISGDIPVLQTDKNGKVTSGLYNLNRYKSKFCSKKNAGEAFENLIDLTKSWKAALAISYAGSSTGNTGNDRMISIDEIVDKMKDAGFLEVKIEKLEHNYRQINNSNNAVIGRDDIEFLVTGKAPC